MRFLLQSRKNGIVFIVRAVQRNFYSQHLKHFPIQQFIKNQIRYKSRSSEFFKDLYTRMASVGNKSREKDVENSTESTPQSKNKNRRKQNQKPLSEYLSEGQPSQQSSVTPKKSSKTPEKNRQRKQHRKKVPQETVEKNLPNFLLSAQSGEEKNSTKSYKGKEGIEYEEEKDVLPTPEKKHNKKHHNKNNRNKLPELHFEEYMKFDDVSDGLKRGELMKGSLRINVRNFNEAFITSDEGGRDIYIDGMTARNRALPGDIVVIKILPKEEWKVKNATGMEAVSEESSSDSDVIKTAKVVFIYEKKHPRVAAGFINIYKNNAFGFALMSPVDSRLPRLMIPLSDCPQDFKTRPKDFEKTLFIARISNWSLNMAFASGELMRSLGEAGHIEPETEALLLSNDIDSSPFKQEVINCLPNGASWRINENELSKRLDLRKECIFTIDPATARDLDDALSCKQIDDDLFEVGVHIADVSHFIEQGNALDKVAMSRATSVYLAQRVIPMLPSVLCEQLCSLNPGVERLAYSVIWNLRSDGTVVKEWFGRTVIRSCTKLSYDHAQQLIESKQGEELKKEQFPDIDGGFPLTKIQEIVKSLYQISVHLRKRRFDSGALRLDQPKLAFALNEETGLPNGFRVYDYQDSNRLIEEFMLLANMAVGHKIYKEHPDRAILRCHPPPHPVMMDDVKRVCDQNNIEFDISDSTTISRSLDAILNLDDDVKTRLAPALTLLCTKPFQNAKYFCTGSIDNEAAYRHYALNVPIYTHFTSPIRRYPDVLVHRFLTAALDDNFKVLGDVKELQAMAEHCNDKKWAAKKASEQSSLLYFAVYLLECGPIIERGVVVGVLDKAVDVLCTRLGVVQRVYCDKLSLYKHTFNMVDLKQELTLYWQDNSNKSTEEKIDAITKRFERKWLEQKNKSTVDEDLPIPEDAVEQKLTMFTPVEVVLSVERNTPTKITAVLKSPFVVDTPEHNL